MKGVSIQPVDWEKTFTKRISDKILVYRTYKELSTTKWEENKHPILKKRERGKISMHTSSKKWYRWQINTLKDA